MAPQHNVYRAGALQKFVYFASPYHNAQVRMIPWGLQTHSHLNVAGVMQKKKKVSLAALLMSFQYPFDWKLIKNARTATLRCEWAHKPQGTILTCALW